MENVHISNLFEGAEKYGIGPEIPFGSLKNTFTYHRYDFMRLETLLKKSSKIMIFDIFSLTRPHRTPKIWCFRLILRCKNISSRAAESKKGDRTIEITLETCSVTPNWSTNMIWWWSDVWGCFKEPMLKSKKIDVFLGGYKKNSQLYFLNSAGQ